MFISQNRTITLGKLLSHAVCYKAKQCNKPSSVEKKWPKGSKNKWHSSISRLSYFVHRTPPIKKETFDWLSETPPTDNLSHTVNGNEIYDVGRCWRGPSPRYSGIRGWAYCSPVGHGSTVGSKCLPANLEVPGSNPETDIPGIGSRLGAYPNCETKMPILSVNELLVQCTRSGPALNTM